MKTNTFAALLSTTGMLLAGCTMPGASHDGASATARETTKTPMAPTSRVAPAAPGSTAVASVQHLPELRYYLISDG